MVMMGIATKQIIKQNGLASRYVVYQRIVVHEVLSILIV